MVLFSVTSIFFSRILGASRSIALSLVLVFMSLACIEGLKPSWEIQTEVWSTVQTILTNEFRTTKGLAQILKGSGVSPQVPHLVENISVESLQGNSQVPGPQRQLPMCEWIAQLRQRSSRSSLHRAHVQCEIQVLCKDISRRTLTGSVASICSAFCMPSGVRPFIIEGAATLPCDLGIASLEAAKTSWIKFDSSRW